MAPLLETAEGKASGARQSEPRGLIFPEERIAKVKMGLDALGYPHLFMRTEGKTMYMGVEGQGSKNKLWGGVGGCTGSGKRVPLMDGRKKFPKRG